MVINLPCNNKMDSNATSADCIVEHSQFYLIDTESRGHSMNIEKADSAIDSNKSFTAVFH